MTRSYVILCIFTRRQSIRLCSRGRQFRFLSISVTLEVTDEMAIFIFSSVIFQSLNGYLNIAPPESQHKTLHKSRFYIDLLNTEI